MVTTDIRKYVSLGTIILKGGKRGVEYAEIDPLNNRMKPDVERLIFKWDKDTGYHTGVTINIEHTENGQFNFKGYAHNKQPEVTAKYLDEFKVRSIEYQKRIEHARFVKKAKSVRTEIEDMKIWQLREWCKGNPSRKKMLRYYLLEQF